MDDHVGDVQLVVALRGGDDQALATLYDRHAPALYNFAYGLLRNPDDAADVVHDSFLLARERIDQLRDATKLRAWLFAIVRNGCMRCSKQRSRTRPSEEVIDLTVDSPNLSRSIEALELQQLVWSAADGLDERDRQLLELTLKQNLEGDELAEIMGVKTATVYVLVNRMKERVERSLGALLVARLGRDDCGDLADLLGDWDGTFSVLWRKRVARHVDECAICERTRLGVASPAALLGAMPLVAIPTGLRDRVLASASAGTTVDAADIRFTGAHGFPELASTAARRSGLVWIAGVAAAFALLVGVLVALNGGDERIEAIEVEIGTAVSITASTSTLAATNASAAVEPGSTILEESEAEVSSVSIVATPTETASDASNAPSPGSAGLQEAEIPVTPTPTTSLAAAGGVDTPLVETPPPKPTTAPAPATTAPPTTTAAPKPASLAVAVGTLDLGLARRSASTNLSNGGGSGTNWKSSGSHSAVTITPSTGTLGPGAAAEISVVVNRTGQGEGNYSSTVTFADGGSSAVLEVKWATATPPTIVRATTSGSTAGTTPRGRSCNFASQLPVTVIATDETSVSLVVATWRNRSTNAGGSLNLVASANDTWTGTFGPFPESGIIEWSAVATDPFGLTATSRSATFEVLPC